MYVFLHEIDVFINYSVLISTLFQLLCFITLLAYFTSREQMNGGGFKDHLALCLHLSVYPNQNFSWEADSVNSRSVCLLIFPVFYEILVV
jgi:hypothetical protein